MTINLEIRASIASIFTLQKFANFSITLQSSYFRMNVRSFRGQSIPSTPRSISSNVQRMEAKSQQQRFIYWLVLFKDSLPDCSAIILAINDNSTEINTIFYKGQDDRKAYFIKLNSNQPKRETILAYSHLTLTKFAHYSNAASSNL